MRRVAAAAILALASCSSRQPAGGTASALRPAVDAPDHFLVGSAASDRTSEPEPGPACLSPMVDPRDGTRLVLVASHAGRGDYEVPAGKYGVGPAEVLRVECATGRPLGIAAKAR